jgi:hypothetical protein
MPPSEPTARTAHTARTARTARTPDPDPLGFANTTFAEVYRQFKLDAPRIQLRIDREDVSRKYVDAPAVFTELLNRYGSWDLGLFVAHCCTQTALARPYVRRARQLRREAAAADRRRSRVRRRYRRDDHDEDHAHDDHEDDDHAHTDGDDHRGHRRHDGRTVLADPGAAVEVHLLDNGCQRVEVRGTDELHIAKGFRIMRMGEEEDRGPSAVVACTELSIHVHFPSQQLLVEWSDREVVHAYSLRACAGLPPPQKLKMD